MRTDHRFVVVSGLSGAGKSTAIKVFEDLGFYCVDNLPLSLLPTFADLVLRSGEGPARVALGVDIREREPLSRFPAVFRALRRKAPAELLFLEASPRALSRRFSETRRRHPLAGGGTLGGAIARETAALAPIRALADRIVDTSDMSVHELKKLLTGTYPAPGGQRGPTITLTSFGYKYGLPYDADIVLDLRFLPNPHFVEALRPLTGKNRQVKAHVLSSPESREFLSRVEGLLAWLIPRYTAEGKSYLTIALGCTGGRHRSVAVAEELKRRLGSGRMTVETNHRDLAKGER